MELRHLRYFVAVAEDLSFTKAAKRLGMAQPPLSYQIRSLEDEIGVRLFDRRSRRVFLTDAGRRFLDAAKALLQQAAAAVDVARQARSGVAGTVRVGFGKGLGDVVSVVINQHLRLYPDVEIDFRDILSGFQVEALRTRKIDVGFLHGRPTSLDLVSEKLFQERFTIVVPRTSPLSRRSRVMMKHLAQQTLILIDRAISPGVHDKILELCRAAELSPNFICSEATPYDETGAMMIASGKGIYFAVGGNPVHPSFADRLIAVPLGDPKASIEVSVSWRKGEAAVTVLNFIDSARKVLQRVSGVQDLRTLPRGLRTWPSPGRQRRKRN